MKCWGHVDRCHLRGAKAKRVAHDQAALGERGFLETSALHRRSGGPNSRPPWDNAAHGLGVCVHRGLGFVSRTTLVERNQDLKLNKGRHNGQKV